MKKNIALRIDDFGASSKEFEIYTKKFGRFGNYIGLHHFKKYRAWAKYQELETHELKTFINLLSNANCKATLGITASWQLKDGTLVSYPDKFPDNVALIKEAIDADLIEIANHGLTHCVTENFSFLPKYFSSNRSYHREYWDWRNPSVIRTSVRLSQLILSDTFGINPIIGVPPGNVWCQSYVEACSEFGIKIINCSKKADDILIPKNIIFINNDNVIALHDKEIKMEGRSFFERLKNYRTMFVSDLIC